MYGIVNLKTNQSQKSQDINTGYKQMKATALISGQQFTKKLLRHFDFYCICTLGIYYLPILQIQAFN